MRESKIMLITAAILLGAIIAEAICWGIIVGFNGLTEGFAGSFLLGITGVLVFCTVLEAAQKARQEGIADACKTVVSSAKGIGH